MHGKDSSPEETIKKIRKILKSVGISVEEVFWRHPTPHVWSVHLRESNCGALYVNGKGTTRVLALASALGEFMERIITGYSFSEFALIGITAQKKFLFAPGEKWFKAKNAQLPGGLLTRRLHALYNPTGELTAQDLADRMSVEYHSNAICSLPFRRVRDQKTVYFPINVLDNLYASNGMAAGNTKEETCVQALSEVFERYVKNTIIRKCIALPGIPKSYYASLGHVVKALNALENAGFQTLVKDASLGGRYPVVSVALIEKKTKKCFLAFGAHPSFAIALSRTVTELLQGQKLGAFRGLKNPSKNKSEVRDHSNLVAHFINSSGVVSEDYFKGKPAYRFKPVDFAGTRKEEEQFLLSIFSKAKKDVYVNAVSIEGFYISRIVVPGWSEVYRPEDLVDANTNRARCLVGYVLKLPAGTSANLKRVLSLIDDGTVGEQEIVTDVLGISLDEMSPWSRLCFGELKLLILLKLGEKRTAGTQLLRCFDAGCLRKEMNDVYECLSGLFEEEDVYGFNKGILYRARELFNGANVFGDLFDRSGEMRGAQAHKKIINVFLKSRALHAKRV